MAEMAEATFEIELLEVTPVENLSPAPSTLLLKTLLERGSGSETPSDGARVTIDVEAAGCNLSVGATIDMSNSISATTSTISVTPTPDTTSSCE